MEIHLGICKVFLFQRSPPLQTALEHIGKGAMKASKPRPIRQASRNQGKKTYIPIMTADRPLVLSVRLHCHPLKHLKLLGLAR